MAVRMYFANATAGYAVATRRGAWDKTSGGSRWKLGRRPEGAAAVINVSTGSLTANWDVWWGWWVSEPAIAAGTLAGTVEWMAGAFEGNAATNAFYHVHIWVTQGASDTLRGTLLTDSIGVTEFPTTATGRGEGRQLLTPVAVQAGDRIIVEMGYRCTSDTTTRSVIMNYGNTGTTDVSSGSTSVTTQPGWIEFDGADGIFARDVDTLTDTFSGGSIDTNVWTGTYGGPFVSGGRARIPVAHTAGTPDYAGIFADYATAPVIPWNLNGSSIAAEITAVPAAGGTSAYGQLAVISDQVGTQAAIRYDPNTGNLVCANNVAYSDATPTTVAYNATTHKWWQIRHDGTSLYWETSADGLAWTTRRTMATAPSWTRYADLSVLVEGARDGGTDDYIEVDNVNSTPTITPPTLVASYASALNTTTSPKTASVTVAVGDILIVYGITADDATTLNTPTGGGLTYTQVTTPIVATDYPAVYAWVATSASAQTFTLSLTTASGADHFGFVAERWSGSDGVGTSAKRNATGEPGNVTLVTAYRNSAVTSASADWTAASGASRAYRTINGITPTAGGAGEVTYVLSAGQYGVYVTTWSDAGPLGPVTPGLTTPSMKHSTLAIEVRGKAGPTVHDGAATLSAGASLTAGATPIRPAATTLSAVAALTADGTRTTGGAATLSAATALAADAVPVGPAAAALSAGTSLTAAGATTAVSAATLSAGATLSAAAVRTTGGAATLAAGATLTAAGFAHTAGAAALSAATVLTAAGVRGTSGAATLSATADLVAAGIPVRAAAAALAAGATLTAAGTMATTGAAILSAGTLLSAAGLPIAQGAATLTAATALTAAGVATTFPAVVLGSSAVLTAAALGGNDGAATLSAATVLTAAGLRTVLPAATLSATTVLTAAAIPTRLGAIALDAGATLLVVGTPVRMAAVDLSAGTLLAAAGIRGTTAAAVLSASAVLAADGSGDGSVGALLSAGTLITAGAVPIRHGAVTLAAATVLSADGQHTGLCVVDLTAGTLLVAGGASGSQAAALLSAVATLTAGASSDGVYIPGHFTVRSADSRYATVDGATRYTVSDRRRYAATSR